MKKLLILFIVIIASCNNIQKKKNNTYRIGDFYFVINGNMNVTYEADSTRGHIYINEGTIGEFNTYRFPVGFTSKNPPNFPRLGWC